MVSAAVNSRWEDVGVEPEHAVLVCEAPLHNAELERTDILIFRFWIILGLPEYLFFGHEISHFPTFIFSNHLNLLPHLFFILISSDQIPTSVSSNHLISFTEFLLPCPELAWKIFAAFLSPQFFTSWNHPHLLAIPKAKLHHCYSYSFLFLPATLRANTKDSHWNSGVKRSTFCCPQSSRSALHPWVNAFFFWLQVTQVSPGQTIT